MKKLNSKTTLAKLTYKQILNYLASIPIKVNSKSNAFDKDLAQVLKDGFQFIHNFYLELDAKSEAKPTLLNMLMLNYDNF